MTLSETQRPTRPKRRRPSDCPVEVEGGSKITAPAMVRNKSLVVAAAVLLASSCCCVEGFTSARTSAAAHQRLMRPASESASENHPTAYPSSSASTALHMVGSIRKQPANFPGGGAGGSGRAEQIARRNQDLLAAAERGDRRRTNPNRGRPQSSRKQKPLSATAAATAEAPSTLNDSFRMKTTSHFEILMPDDITLSSSSSSKSTEAPTPEQLENAEARTRKSLVDAKIAALLADDDEDDGDIADGDLADKQTVYTRLSDTAKSQATAAISKSTSYGAASSGGGGAAAGAPLTAASAAGSRRVVSKKKRVTAQVQETGRDTIQSYTKSFTNHELLSRESEAALGREIQILARWEERRQDLEVQLMR